MVFKIIINSVLMLFFFLLASDKSIKEYGVLEALCKLGFLMCAILYIHWLW